MFDFMIYAALLAIMIGSFTDLKTLEVPDWLNYSLIAVGVGGNLIMSLFHGTHIYIVRSLIGLGVSLLLGTLMFYTGQWGGGDSKMLFGLGAMLGISWPVQYDFYLMFLVNLLFAGAFYGILWVIALSFRHWKKIKIRLMNFLEDKRLMKIRIITGAVSLAAMAALFFSGLDNDMKLVASGAILLLYFLNYLFIFVRSVEQTAMIKTIDPKKLTEGDWIMQEVKIDGKLIAGPKDLGLEKKQLTKILELREQGKLMKIKVKYGIPFVPSFLISFVFTLMTRRIFLFLFF
jgi:Flp pilus assembly protein protease CpaA